MEEFYFLFGLGLIWSFFAAVQDYKSTEVANWLNFSLIVFGLSYRAFYASVFSEGEFFAAGLVGFIMFFALAHVFYYGRAFAGGDAKLLMGIGAVLPYSDFSGLLFWGFFFILILMFVGFFYSLIYSGFLVFKRKNEFVREFKKVFNENKKMLWILAIGVVGIAFLDLFSLFLFEVFILIGVFLYLYIRALDFFMLRKKSADQLMEGDWLDSDIKVKGKIIRKSVHGLSREEIELLKKAKKEVYVKEGIPFTAVFFISYSMVFFLAVLKAFEVFSFPL